MLHRIGVAAHALAHALACTLAPALTLAATTRTQDPSTPTAPTVRIPAFAGYAHPEPEAMRRRDDGSVPRCDGTLVFYLHLAQPGALQVTLERTANARAATVQLRLQPHPGASPAGPTTTSTAAADATTVDLGTLTATRAGWHRLELASPDQTPLHDLAAIVVRGDAAAGLHTNTAERRNAASIHLGYDVPREQRDDVTWFYVEATPQADPLWTYYMATGWHRGYFGIQVNSKHERRVIFSVWDAGDEAKDRAKVGAADRVTLIAKGDGVVAGDFGNEGTGGHSHLVHDWRLGDTFRFLLHAAPDGDATTYTGWFWFAAEQRWGLIASFRAPKDGKHARGLYSFVENFSGANGDVARSCVFGNAWVRGQTGDWVPLLKTHFTHDPTGERVRRDRWGGIAGDRFVLHQGGFDDAPARVATKARSPLVLAKPAGQPPLEADLPTPPRAR